MRGGVRGAVRCVAVFALAAGAVACGGSDDDAAGTETESVAVEEIAVSVLADPEVIGLVEVIAGDVGDDMVFEAVALALDRGYSVEQLSEVGGTGAVSADGVIVGVDPVGESFGVLLVDDAVASFGRTADATVPVEDLAEAIAPVHDDFNWRVDLDEDLQNNVVLAGVLVTLVEMGYSFDQVVEGVVFGELSVRYATELKSYTTGSELVGIGCVTLADGTGSVVVPSRDPVPGTVSNAYRCGQAARNGQLLTTEEVADRIRADRAGEDTAESTPDTGAATDGDAADSYRLTVVLDLSDDGGFIRYDWNGEFRLDEDGTVAGTGTVSGSSAGTCSSPGFDGTVEGPYAYSVVGAFDIVGQESGDQLEISMANPTASFTSEDGDRSILCVEITADLALDFGRIPLGAAELELGSIVVPAAGGSATIDAGEGLVFAIDVSPV